jgi:hypothetical protein
MRVRTRYALKGKRKSKRTMEYVGCDAQWLFDHISRQLIDTDMNWDNYGSFWHIDHILPLSQFDLNREHDQRVGFGWWNLRPLHGPENLSKGAKPPTKAELLNHYGKLVGPGEFWQSVRPKR